MIFSDFTRLLFSSLVVLLITINEVYSANVLQEDRVVLSEQSIINDIPPPGHFPSTESEAGTQNRDLPLLKYRPTNPAESRPRPVNEGIRQRGTTVYSEGFEPGNESGDLPSGWEVKRNTAADGGLNGNNLVTANFPFWVRGSIDHLYLGDWEIYVRTDSASLGISYLAPDFTWAITPEIELPVDDLIELSFWMWYNNTDTTHFYLTIFSDNVWTTLESWVGEPSNLFDTQVNINITAYAGKTIKLGFVYEDTDGYEMAIDDILITANSDSFITWTGDISTVWTDPGNWNSGLPLATDDVVIPGGLTNYPQITGNDTCNNLTIDENATLIIATAGKLTINGVLSNLAGANGLILKSDELNADASLVHFTAGVQAKVERYISGSSLAWHQLSSPVSQQQIVTDFHEAGDALFVWHEPAQVWVSVSNTTVWPSWNDANQGETFNPGKGYLAAYPHSVVKSNPTKTFEGVLNQGEVSFGITRQAHPDDAFTGFNLVGNPYPSAIDWEAATGWERNALVNNGGYSYWVWNDGGSGNYGVYITGGTGTNGVSQYISPMQGFWVEAGANGSLTMNNEVRTHAGQMWLKNEPAELRLAVTSNANTYSDEVVFVFGKQNDAGGATKMFSMLPDAPGLYTPKSGKNYSISFLTTTDEHTSVPVALKPGVDALYTLSLKVDNDFNHLLLEDRITGIFHNFSKFPDYTFSATPGDDEHRFVLHFKVLGTDEMRKERIQYFYNSGHLHVLNPMNTNLQIRLLELSGRVVNEYLTNNPGMHLFSINIPPGLYLLQFLDETSVTSGKILIY